jgi:hypothetical protein
VIDSKSSTQKKGKEEASEKTPLSASTSSSIEEGFEKATKAQAKLLRALVKRNISENIIPIFIQLKDLLQNSKSGLVKDVLICIREIVRDFMGDIREMISSDQLLASELEFDFRTEVKRKERERRKMMKEKNEGKMWSGLEQGEEKDIKKVGTGVGEEEEKKEMKVVKQGEKRRGRGGIVIIIFILLLFQAKL